MAERMIKMVAGLAFCLMVAAFSLQSSAEVLPDPTRPPPEASMTTETIGKAASGPVLQSVKIAPGRRTAMIDGQLLKEGEPFGDAKLIKIAEGEVVLSGPGGRQTLKLFPGVEKTPSHAGTMPQHGKFDTKRKAP